MDDLRLCIDWLIRCQVLPKDHPFTLTIYPELPDFIQYLKDGVLLCQLVNKLIPNSIDNRDICYRPQSSQCLCVKNIKIFLQACRKIFLIKEPDIFEPLDLFEARDIAKVIHTLSILSQTIQVCSLNISPFILSSKKNSAYYNATGCLTNFIPISNDDDDTCQFTNHNDADVYGRLVDLLSPLHKDQCQKSKREMCIKELIVTEQNYIEALQMIKMQFMRPLRDALTAPDFAIIFKDIERLHLVHSGFHDDLKRAWSTDLHSNLVPTIPDCFVTWKERFLIYGEFCSNLPTAQNLLDSLCSNNFTIQRKVEQCQMSANEGKFKLRDLLSVPMQRVLKYHLFLKELIKHTEVNHIERKSLEKALDEIQDLSLYVNEVKRDNEALMGLEDIARSITEYQMPEKTSLKDYGRLIYDGDLKVKSHTDQKTKTRYGFLFDKVLLLCKPKGEFFSYKSALLTSNYDIEEIAYKEKNFGYAFLLGEKSRESAFTFGCKTLELKNQWINMFKVARSNINPPYAHNALHDFVMASFKEATICDVCRKLLRGVFFQGYRCEKTHMVVHKDCIERARDMTGPPKLPPKPQASKTLSFGSRQTERPSRGKLKVLCGYYGVPQPSNGRMALNIDVDQVVDLLCDEDSQWLEGRYLNREGYFPKECVRILNESLLGDSCPLHAASFPPSSFHDQLRSSFQDQPIPFAQLNPFPWFAGSMSREEASHVLEHLADGAYLIRVSKSDSRRGEYALSIKYGVGQPVKHIKIQRSREDLFFIADNKMFRSVIELVQHYQMNSLQPSFSEVPTCLSIPYKDILYMLEGLAVSDEPCVIGHCRAQYDYSAMESNQLTLRRGDGIAILSKAGANKGWWRGMLHNKIGYFPSAFVIDDDDCF